MVLAITSGSRDGCMVFTYSKSKDQPGKVVIPTRGKLYMENEDYISLSLFAPENLVSRDEFGSPVPRQPAHLHTLAESGAYLRDSSRFPRYTPPRSACCYLFLVAGANA